MPKPSKSKKADLLIKDIAWLITVDKGRRIIRDAAIAVTKGKIAAIGKSTEIEAAFAADTVIDAGHTVATPGFIDCHLHSSFHLIARARRRGQRAVVPVRPHVPL